MSESKPRALDFRLNNRNKFSATRYSAPNLRSDLEPCNWLIRDQRVQYVRRFTAPLALRRTPPSSAMKAFSCNLNNEFRGK